MSQLQSAPLPAAFTSAPINSSSPDAKQSAINLRSWIESDVANNVNLVIHNYWGTSSDSTALYAEQQLWRQPGKPWTPLLNYDQYDQVALVSHTILRTSPPHSAGHGGITKSAWLSSSQLATCNNDSPLDGWVIFSFLVLLMKRHPNVFVINSLRRAACTNISSTSAANAFDTDTCFANSIHGFDPEQHNIVVFLWHDPVSLFHWAVGILLIEAKDHTLFSFDSLPMFPVRMKQDISNMISCFRHKFKIDEVPLKIDSTQHSCHQQTGLSCGVMTLWNVMWFVAHQEPAPEASPSALSRLRLFTVASILAGGQIRQEVLDKLPAGLFVLPPTGGPGKVGDGQSKSPDDSSYATSSASCQMSNLVALPHDNQACTSTIECV